MYNKFIIKKENKKFVTCKNTAPVGASKMTLAGAADFTYLIAKEWGNP